jgi:predicted RNase H-like nuclease (RuvC/YqgF family)
MARQPMDIRKRIERQEKKIIALTDRLEQAKEEYEKLQTELKEQEKTEIFEAYQKSRRSYSEVIDFLRGKADI